MFSRHFSTSRLLQTCLYSQIPRFKMSEKQTSSKSTEDTEPASSDSTKDESSTAALLDKLQKCFAEKLGLSDGTEKPKILDSLSLEGIAEYIKKNDCKYIITMAGAGISTSAGIPDFRSPGSGLYHNLAQYKLPHPQAIFELDFFKENPKPFFVLAKELYPGSFKPTIAHYFIKLLLEKKVLLRHYTQNIDTLERITGIPDDKIVEAHGTFFTGHCLKCRKEYALEWMKERIFKDEIPKCEAKNCKGVVKPDIVFFGETLPNKFYDLTSSDFSKCDLLIIMGSSLVVQPFASLVDLVPQSCPRLLINREKAGQKSGLMSMFGGSEGLNFDGKNNSRDVAWLGDCNEGCQLLADKLGWGEELKKMRDTAIAELDQVDQKSSL